MRDVFNPSDFDTEKRIWDKRMKTEFIQRLIDHTAKNERPVVGCVAAKVIAGLEPNKTNELLQALASLAQVRLSGQDAPSSRPRTFTRVPASALNLQKNTNIQSKQHQRQSNGQQVLTARNPYENVEKQTNRELSGYSGQMTSAKSSRSGSLASSKPDLVGKLVSRKEGDVNGNGSSAQIKTTGSIQDPSQLTCVQNAKSNKDFAEKAKTILSVPSQNLRESNQQIITSESDIGKHIPQLKISLKQLRVALNNISQSDARLRMVFNQKETYDAL